MKYSKELLAKAVAESQSYMEVLRRLGLSHTSGGMHAHIKSRVQLYQIDTSHFRRCAHNKGKSYPKKHWSERLIYRDKPNKLDSATLRRALLESGRPHLCAFCGCPPEWRGEPLTL